MINIHFSPAGMDLDAAVALTKLIGPEHLTSVKIHDLCDRYGVAVVIAAFKAIGVRLAWVDYKLHDIPKTVGKRAQALTNAGADIITVHADDEGDMIRAALESGARIFGVTILTSQTPEQVFRSTGKSVEEAVLDRAIVAKKAGAHGVVASCKEVRMLLNHPELKGIELIIPGARSPGVALGDQARSDTPEAMVRFGIRNLVVESEVVNAFINAGDPLAAFEKFVAGAKRGLTPAS